MKGVYRMDGTGRLSGTWWLRAEDTLQMGSRVGSAAFGHYRSQHVSLTHKAVSA